MFQRNVHPFPGAVRLPSGVVGATLRRGGTSAGHAENRIMASADYFVALNNGIDAARSGSRTMARLHLLKAVDVAPDEIASHLWLAWVAETPADAMTHIEDALARNSRHALARVGRLWASTMAEYDATQEYADCDVGELVAPTIDSAGDASAVTMRLAATQRLSELAGSERQAPVPCGEEEPLDTTRTVQMDLVRRERDGDDVEPSPAPSGPVSPTPANPPSDATAAEPSASSAMDEPVGSSTIRLDPQAVKRALAETVMAEMTSPERSTQTASTCDEVGTPASESDASGSAEGDIDRHAANAGIATPGVDEYTEPPRAVLTPDALETARASIAAPSNGPRVLIVDDSPTVRKLVGTTLESSGYRVASVASGYEAVELLSKATPDALIIETDLPRLDGLHLCKLLRSQEATRHTPVIFLTRRNGTMDRMRGKLVGATAYLTKPFRSASLLEELAACCPVGEKPQPSSV